MPKQRPSSIDAGSANSSRLNRAILLLNLAVLVVTFVLASQTMDSQIGLMRSSAETGNLSLRRGGGDAMESAALPCARVLQALEGLASGQDSLTSDKVRAVFEAVRVFQRTTAQGVADLVLQPAGAEDLRQEYSELGKAARAEVEITLAKEFSDPEVVRRLTTEVIRACQ